MAKFGKFFAKSYKMPLCNHQSSGISGIFTLINKAWQWRQERRRIAFAVVVAAAGSAPRPAGARLLLAEDGAFAGSVSGGCVESDVAAAAMEVINNGIPQMLTFDAADGEWRAGLSCGGDIGVFVHQPEDEVINKMRQLAAARRPMTVITNLTTGKQSIDEVHDNDATMESATSKDGIFVETILPARRLFIIGATHIAQCIIPMAAVLEMECIIIDPRAAFASGERFADAKVLNEWGDNAFAKTPPDKRDAVIALTHDPKIDDPALLAAMTKSPAYIGALGSTRTHAKRLTRLRAAGADDASLANIHAPIGFDIGAKTPAEIAASVIAEMIAAFRNKATNRAKA